MYIHKFININVFSNSVSWRLEASIPQEKRANFVLTSCFLNKKSVWVIVCLILVLRKGINIMGHKKGGLRKETNTILKQLSVLKAGKFWAARLNRNIGLW